VSKRMEFIDSDSRTRVTICDSCWLLTLSLSYIKRKTKIEWHFNASGEVSERSHLHKKNDFADASKNLITYRSENSFV